MVTVQQWPMPLRRVLFPLEDLDAVITEPHASNADAKRIILAFTSRRMMFPATAVYHADARIEEMANVIRGFIGHNNE